MHLELLDYKKGIVFIHASNEAGLDVVFCNIGASIYSIKIDEIYVSLTPKSFEEFIHSKHFFGKTIGRICGRVKDGKLTIEDKTYQMEHNEGKNCLHSGSDSIAFKKWNYSYRRIKGGAIITFIYRSKWKESGLNGHGYYSVTYKIPEDQLNLVIEHEASCSKPTYMNLTNHLYLNLGEENILNHTLYIDSKKVVKMDDELCYQDVIPANPIFDFSKPHLISEHIHDSELVAKKLNGYDSIFVLNDSESKTPKLILESSKYLLRAYSNYPSVLIYTDGYPTQCELIDGKKEEEFQGATIEFEHPKPIYLAKREPYHFKSRLEFERK